MDIKEIIELIQHNSDCSVTKNTDVHRKINPEWPEEVQFFYANFDGIDFYPDKSYGIRIVSFEEIKPTNQVLFPENDVIWEELEDDISNDWFLIAESEELEQYISIDFTKEKPGYCYDSMQGVHSEPGAMAIIAKSFSELLERIYNSNGDEWYWLSEDFTSYGDAYDE